MKKILTIVHVLFVTMAFAQMNLTSSENYIYSKTCLNGDCSKVSENVQYFDSWGKPTQTIDIKATPLGRDVVSHIEYDPSGRQTKSYLPVPQQATQNGAIYTSPLANASAVYGTEKIYSEKILENSPLDRIQQQVQIGNKWADKPVNFTYDANTDGEVTKYTVSTTWAEGRSQSALSNSGNYAVGTLAKNTVTNEDNNLSIEFKNKKGQTVLLRKKDNGQNVDTYYIYNEYGQLAYVLPPLAAHSGQVDQGTLDNLCYQYRYDGWNRLAEKKIPGKGWEYMVYDKADRLILTQDANMGASKQWLFTKYDRFGRVVYTGIYTSSRNYGSAGRNAEQADAYSSAALNESRDATGFAANGVTAYYTNSAYPASFTKILSVNYYDTYPQGSITRPAQIMGGNTIGDIAADAVNTQALPTASLVKNLEDDGWTKSYIWYDTKKRAIGTHAVNYLGGYTKTESSLDFAGVVQQSKVYHKRLAGDNEKIIAQTFEYDGQGRLKKQWHQVNSQPQELLAENTYNELSQVINKKVGNNLQSIDYTYNIRGAMTTVNDPSNLGTDLFGYSLSYFDPTNTSAGRYSNNISEVTWKTAQDNVLRKYAYEYDALNRMKKGIYSEPAASVPQNNLYNESATYDMNSNILTLQRNTIGASGTASLMDNLSYSYTGNRLTSLTDSSTNYSGYPDTSGNAIAYDSNGNMKDHKDKGVLEIRYNLLNLPDYVKFDKTYIPRFDLGSEDYNVNTQYLYRADGTKLRKSYTYGSGKSNAQATRITEYLDGFQYEAADTGLKFSLKLKFVPTAEGYYDFENNQYIYSYTDHLGNVRLSYLKNTAGSAEVLEENNFYPFGLKHEGYNQTSGNPSYNYQYNGKELQKETGWSDYGARMYMADIGRWGVIDPLAEQMRRHSPYNYAFNNPSNFVDPDGMAATKWDAYGHWDFDPNTTIMGGDFFEGMNNYNSNQMSFWQDAAGGGGGTTIGNMMKGFGVELGSLDSFMQLSLVLNLRQQLINAGLDPSAKTSYKDLGKLLMGVSSLTELYQITEAEFMEDSNLNSPGATSFNLVSINMKKNKDLLTFAFTVGHEMYGHVFANLFFKDKFSEVTGIPTSSPRTFKFFQEVMGIRWEMDHGATRYGNRSAIDAGEFYYGGIGHGQSIIDRVRADYSRLTYEWNKIYNIQKNKIK